MKYTRFVAPALLFGAIATSFVSCEDDISNIGSSLMQGEVTIVSDSSFSIYGKSVHSPVFDSRSTTNLLGHISVPGYGDLSCSFVSQLMSAGAMDIPDSIGVERVDSMKLFLKAARGSATGDTLAPQKVNVYRLTKRLPADIDNSFNPQGYYSKESFLGSQSYALTALNMKDSAYFKNRYIDIQVPMPLELARTFFNDYRTKPDIFVWPDKLADYFAGIYVEPSFGRGCITNIAQAQMITYYYRLVDKNFVEGETNYLKQVHQKDSVILFGTAPEALNSNNISLAIDPSIQARIDAGECFIVAPGGYNVTIKFPIRQILQKYNNDNYNLAVINNLTFGVGASPIKNDYGLAMPPYLLMVKTSELDEFFAQNKLPDNKTSFYGAYSSQAGRYNFTSMRDYMIEIVQRLKNGGELTADDEDFTLVPVYIGTNTTTNSSGQSVTTVTECTPYIYRPTICQIFFDKSFVSFTYSKQQIN